MADEREDLRLNTLHRFSKHAQRLVLEEHSHCEVPAGCGGVVLRWRDPATGLPLSVYFATLGEAELWIDGQLAPSSQIELAPGAHTLAFRVDRLPDQPSPVALVVRHGAAAHDTPLLVSRADGSLRGASARQPAGPPPIGEGQPLPPFHGDPAAIGDKRRWWFDHQRERCDLLEVPPRGPLWVLRSVVVDERGGIR
ncbi:MAG TPA: hypothetical protein ENK18_00465 [Deltaproteobacteria bacterium]|nr:hypothetical protein [Deltaproteobacteria bacterium]